ncbi:asparaginase [Marinivivus vitaminiproducens]|uniref:asparaginase n=1 Tax=Marinivivus vitaminiproducens TaxID=3035935 RepID=UPI00279A6AD3|nr:asparaginase [Geminicoccaceae bacterium SCSIO 64248]
MIEPLVVEVLRAGRIESRHHVSVCAIDAEGRRLLSAGDTEQVVFPRSSIKMIQALPLVETGAADAYDLSPAELALACASHSGEPRHVERVRNWLLRLGVTPDDLACGAHRPLDRTSADAETAAGHCPGREHNNCSGKHAGMLTTALHMGEPIAGYVGVGHPVQARIAAALCDLAGLDGLPAPGIDGCSAPNWPVPLRALALALARFGAPDDLGSERAAACRRLAAAMSAHPELVAGRDRACTRILRAARHLVVKTGAEGVYVAAWPERAVGVALKVEDGAGRAAEVAILAALDALGALDARAQRELEPLRHPVLRNFAGDEIGAIRPALGWPRAA